MNKLRQANKILIACLLVSVFLVDLASHWLGFATLGLVMKLFTLPFWGLDLFLAYTLFTRKNWFFSELILTILGYPKLSRGYEVLLSNADSQLPFGTLNQVNGVIMMILGVCIFANAVPFYLDYVHSAQEDKRKEMERKAAKKDSSS